jgi:hypothetical protein
MLYYLYCELCAVHIGNKNELSIQIATPNPKKINTWYDLVDWYSRVQCSEKLVEYVKEQEGHTFLLVAELHLKFVCVHFI